MRLIRAIHESQPQPIGSCLFNGHIISLRIEFAFCANRYVLINVPLKCRYFPAGLIGQVHRDQRLTVAISAAFWADVRVSLAVLPSFATPPT